MGNSKNHFFFGKVLKRGHKSQNSIFFFFLFLLLFLFPFTVWRRQPARRSRLTRGRWRRQRTPGWMPRTETAASREKDANTTVIAGPGGEMVVMLAQIPTGSSREPSRRFSERDEKLKKIKIL